MVANGLVISNICYLIQLWCGEQAADLDEQSGQAGDWALKIPFHKKTNGEMWMAPYETVSYKTKKAPIFFIKRIHFQL